MRDTLQRLGAPLSVALRIGALGFLGVMAAYAPWQHALAVLGAPLALAGALPFALVLLAPGVFGIQYAGAQGAGGAAVAACILFLTIALRAAGRMLPSPDTCHGKFVRRYPAVFRWLTRAGLVLAALAVLQRAAPLVESLLWLAALAVFGNGLPRPVQTATRTQRVAAWGMLLVSVAVGLGLAEATARMVLPKNILSMAYFYEYHPESAYLLRPGTSSYHAIRVGRNEYRHMHVTISSQGFRDRELESKADGEFRILLLGDSNAMGWALDPPDTPGAQLERILRERWPGGMVTVVNGGMGNSGPWQQRVLLHKHGFPVDPDLVVHQLYVGNDIENTLWKRRLHVAPSDPGGARAAFAQWSRHGRAAVRAERWLCAHAALYHLWLRAAGHRDWATRLLDSLRVFPAASAGSEYWSPDCPPWVDRPLNIEMCLAEWPPIVEKGWALFREDVRAVRADCLARGVAYVAYAQPGPETIVDRMWQLALNKAGPDVAYERYRDVVEAERFFEEDGIPFVPMLDAFRDHPDPHALFIPYDGHPTAAGARLAAEQLAEYVLRHFAPGAASISGAPVQP